MLDIKQIANLNELNTLKSLYFAQSTSPLDGMWHFGFVPMSTHFGFYEEGHLIGYCCVNSDGYLLQYYLDPASTTKTETLFQSICNHSNPVLSDVKGAFVSTAEPRYLSQCLDNSDSFQVNALMYQQNHSVSGKLSTEFKMVLASEEQLTELVAFASEAIGAPTEWLMGYYGNLIQRDELWMYKQAGKIIATGECRRFDEHQTHYADLGMIVAKNQRGKGLATNILIYLTQQANQHDLSVICSTESTNIAAQKAMSKAGLTSNHRIIQFDFK